MWHSAWGCHCFHVVQLFPWMSTTCWTRTKPGMWHQILSKSLPYLSQSIALRRDLYVKPTRLNGHRFIRKSNDIMGNICIRFGMYKANEMIKNFGLLCDTGQVGDRHEWITSRSTPPHSCWLRIGSGSLSQFVTCWSEPWIISKVMVKSMFLTMIF